MVSGDAVVSAVRLGGEWGGVVAAVARAASRRWLDKGVSGLWGFLVFVCRF